MKWWLAHWYAAGWPIVIVDIKKKFNDPPKYAEKPEESTLEAPYLLQDGHLVAGARVSIYHPKVPGWKDPDLNRLLLEIMARGNTVLDMDELRGVANQNNWPLGYELILTQGRQSHIPTISGFQTPVRIPTDQLEQSEWWVIFRQNNPEYRQKLVDMTGFPELIERPEKYYYWLANEAWDAPVLMAPVPLIQRAA